MQSPRKKTVLIRNNVGWVILIAQRTSSQTRCFRLSFRGQWGLFFSLSPITVIITQRFISSDLVQQKMRAKKGKRLRMCS